jgi:hypothetical protein
VPSFDDINYSLRVNKNVERKLLVEVLGALRPECPIENYQYLGFGSIWYVDFILMHKRLGISDMVSVEKEMSRLDRAEFNRPYSCVEVLGGLLSSRLPAMEFKKPIVAWLDYDDGIAGPLLKDLTELIQKAPSNSVVAVTCNAERRQLDATPDGVVHDASADQETKREAVLRFFAADLVPTPLPKGTLGGAEFKRFLGTMLFDQMSHAVRKAGRTDKLVPLFNFAYSDGAAMVTVGALLADDGTLRSIRSKKQAAKHKFFFTDEQFLIEVPHLTHREKLAFDRHLPAKKPLNVKTLQFTIPDRLVKNYEQLYSYYPVFEELL